MSDSTLPPLPSGKTFATELIKARQERGWTQGQLSSNSGISLSAIKAYETGRNLPGARELRELCQALQVSPNRLLFGTEVPFKERSFADVMLDMEGEDEGVARLRLTLLFSLLAADERAAVVTLAKSIAIARHGEAKVRETILMSDLLVGMTRDILQRTGDAARTGEPVSIEGVEEAADAFMRRQGHEPPSDGQDSAPNELPKK